MGSRRTKQKIHEAFESWLRDYSGNDITKAAAALRELYRINASRLAREYLDLVGDEELTDETFLKAAQIALKNAERNRS